MGTVAVENTAQKSSDSLLLIAVHSPPTLHSGARDHGIHTQHATVTTHQKIGLSTRRSRTVNKKNSKKNMFVFGVTLPQEYYYDNWYVGAKSSGDCNSLLSSSSSSSSNIIRPYGARLVCLPVSPRMQRPHLTNPTQSQFFPGFITPALVTACRSRRWRIWVRYITSGICHPCEKDSSSKSCFSVSQRLRRHTDSVFMSVFYTY